MLHKTSVLLWEIWRLGQRETLGRASVLLGLLGLLALGVLERNVGDGPASLVIRSVVILIVMEICIASSLIWRALDPKSQVGLNSLFSRPASTRMIVAVRMGFAVALNTAMYTFVALAASWIYTPAFPVAGGAAVVALCSAILACTLWSPATLAGRGVGSLVGLSLVAVVFGLLNLRANLPEPFVMAAADIAFFQLDVTLCMATVLGVAGCLAITCSCVAVQRRGDILLWESWCSSACDRCWSLLSGKRGSRFTTCRSGSKQPFATSVKAQYWCEFRTHGVPTIVVATLLAGVGLVVGGIVLLVNPMSKVDVLWFIALFFGPLAFQLISADGASNVKANGSTAAYSPFYGALPLSNQQLVRIKLVSIALHSSLGFLILLAGMAIHFTVFGWNRIAGIWPALSRLAEDTTPLWWVSALAMLVWTYISCSGMTLNVGYLAAVQTKRFWALAIAVYLHGIALVLLAAEEWPYVDYWAYYAYALAAAVTLFGCRSIFASLQERQLKWSLLVGGIGLFTAYVAALGYVGGQLESLELPPVPILILGLSLMTIPLVGLLTVASSLARHRHA
ncbi:MAG: hypothetical protein Aurels2KO_04230 [Aureliella sp.]